MPNQFLNDSVRAQWVHELRTQFNIQHVTIQVESKIPIVMNYVVDATCLRQRFVSLLVTMSSKPFL